MDNTTVMSVLQRFEKLFGKIHGLLPGQSAVFLYIFLKSDAVQILHHDELDAVGEVDVKDFDYVFMIQHADSLGFIAESAHQIIDRCELLLEDLDCNRGTVFEVCSLVNIGHAADADQFVDLITSV